jgi:hypothetical protein
MLALLSLDKLKTLHIKPPPNTNSFCYSCARLLKHITLAEIKKESKLLSILLNYNLRTCKLTFFIREKENGCSILLSRPFICSLKNSSIYEYIADIYFI